MTPEEFICDTVIQSFSTVITYKGGKGSLYWKGLTAAVFGRGGPQRAGTRSRFVEKVRLVEVPQTQAETNNAKAVSKHWPVPCTVWKREAGGDPPSLLLTLGMAGKKRKCRLEIYTHPLSDSSRTTERERLEVQ